MLPPMNHAPPDSLPPDPLPPDPTPSNPHPLPDLHRHLDGSLRPATLRALAATAHVPLPEDIRFTPHMGLDQALARFTTTLACLRTPQALTQVAHEICQDAAAQNTTTLEIRFAPHLHAMPLATAIDATLEGIAGRAKLILCALYGDPPDLAIKLIRLAIPRPQVTALDLAGAPAPHHRYTLPDYAPAFTLARRHDIGRTVHAAEGRPPTEITQAITHLHAQRIGHATTLLDDPRATDLVLTRGITLEACLTSNHHTGAIPTLAAHPLPRWLNLGIKACINTDNTLLSDTTAPQEHHRAAQLPGMTPALLQTAIAHGHAAAFHR